jgi:hypothetical protein
MGKSHQSGWIVLRGKRWYGYYRKQVIDPTTECPGQHCSSAARP